MQADGKANTPPFWGEVPQGLRESVVSLELRRLSAGFIDFIVEPTFTVLTDMTEKIVSPLIEETSQAGGTGQRRSRSVEKLRGWGPAGLPLRVELFFGREGGGWCFLMRLALLLSGKRIVCLFLSSAEWK